MAINSSNAPLPTHLTDTVFVSIEWFRMRETASGDNGKDVCATLTPDIGVPLIYILYRYCSPDIFDGTNVS